MHPCENLYFLRLFSPSGQTAKAQATATNYGGFVIGPPTQAATSVDTAGLTSAKFHIEGMTCEGCANILHGALTKLPDVNAAEVDFAAKTAVVRYKPDKPVPPERVIEAVKAVGYNATPAEKAPQERPG